MPENICSLIEEFIDKLRSSTIGLGIYFSIENPNEETLKEKMNIWHKAWNSAKEDVPVARREIEREFRVILGEDSDNIL